MEKVVLSLGIHETRGPAYPTLHIPYILFYLITLLLMNIFTLIKFIF